MQSSKSAAGQQHSLAVRHHSRAHGMRRAIKIRQVFGRRHLGGLLRGPNRTLGHWASRRNTPEFGFFRFPILDEYEYRIARYGNVWTSDDSNKAWGMLFESEAWPPPCRVKSNINMANLAFDPFSEAGSDRSNNPSNISRSVMDGPKCNRDILGIHG